MKLLRKGRHFDFVDEEAEPITFSYHGETYRCRGTAPALPQIRAMRAELNGKLEQEATAKMMLELMEAVFEDGELDRILATGISLPRLLEIVRQVMAVQQGGR